MTCAIAQPRLTGYDAFVLSSRDYGVQFGEFHYYAALNAPCVGHEDDESLAQYSSMPDAFIWLSLDEDLP